MVFKRGVACTGRLVSSELSEQVGWQAGIWGRDLICKQVGKQGTQQVAVRWKIFSKRRINKAASKEGRQTGKLEIG